MVNKMDVELNGMILLMNDEVVVDVIDHPLDGGVLMGVDLVCRIR